MSRDRDAEAEDQGDAGNQRRADADWPAPMSDVQADRKWTLAGATAGSRPARSV